MNLQFEPEAIKFLNLAEKTNKCIYLTGLAGAWKSTLVNYFISKTKKKFVMLGTTWVSAEMIWGTTIHRFFWLQKWWRIWLSNDDKEVIRETNIFIIDEVSMMRADLFDKLEKLMRDIMESEEFFWGKQFVFVWDLHQLPPVPEQEFFDKNKTHKNPYYTKYHEKYGEWLFFFDWLSYKQECFEKVQLQKVFRQTDMDFVDMLNRVRAWDGSREVLSYFNKKYTSKNKIHPKSILIATTNFIADKYNRERLESLPWQAKISKAYINGEFPDVLYPNDIWVNFKKNCRVMFISNDKQWGYMNGTLWTIKEIYNDSVTIIKDDGMSIDVKRNQWQHTDWYDDFGNPILLWTFTQYPFKLAFGITIHKCQGKSFDYVTVDLWYGAFAPWQVYVAFSRARTYEGLQLVKMLKTKDIQTSEEVTNYLKDE